MSITTFVRPQNNIIFTLAFCITIFVSVLSPSHSQIVETDAIAQPFNLDFEYSPEGLLPTGWWIGSTSKDIGFVAVASREQYADGQQSLLVVNTKPTDLTIEGQADAQATVFQTVDAFQYRGRKVRISVAGKLKDINSGNGFRVWIRDKFADGKIGAQGYNDEYISATEWTTDMVEFRVDNRADFIEFGIETRGQGPFFLDAFQVEYADRIIVTPMPPQQLNDKIKNNIYTLGSIQYAIKAFNPYFEGAVTNWTSVLYSGIKDAVAGKDLKEIIRNRYQPIVSGMKISSQPIKETPLKRQEKYDEMVSYAWTHKGIYNMNMSDPLSSAVVNIYQPVRDQQAVVFKTTKISQEIKGLPVNLSAMIKTAPIGPGAHAQLWLRYENRDNRIIATKTMYDDMVRTSDWTKIRLLDTVPSDADKMTFALVVTGEGKFWFDDVKVGFKQGEMITYINMENDDFEDSDDFPESWKVTDGTYDFRYRVGIDQDISYNGNALKVWTPKSEFENLAKEGETITLEYLDDKQPLYVNFPLNVYMAGIRTYPKPEIDIKEVRKQYLPLALSSEDLISRLTLVADIAGMKENFSIENLTKDEIMQMMDEAGSGSVSLSELMKMGIKYMDDPAARAWNISEYDRYTIPAYLEALSGEYIVVTNTYDENLFKIGDRVVDINGKPIWDEVNNYVDKSADPNKLLSLRKALIDLVSFPLPNKIEIGIIDTSGARRLVKVTADFPASKVSQRGLGATKEMDEETVYIDLRSMNDKKFKNIAEEMGKYETYLFDMRGSSAISEYMLGYFTDEEIENVEYRLKIFNRPGPPTDTLIFESTIKPLEGLEDKEVYFLIDERTSGSMELIAYLARENNIGKLVGMPTSGTLAEANSTTIIDDYNLMLTAFEAYDNKGKPLRGIATSPHILSGSDIKSVYLGYDNVIIMAYKDSTGE